MTSEFRYTVGSIPGFSDLVGDIYYGDLIVCVLSQESGFDRMKIEIFAPPGGGTWVFRLSDFEEILSTLKDRMWQLRRENPQG